MDQAEKIIFYKQAVAETLANVDNETIRKVISLIEETRINHKQIFIMGNGGSGATASHITGDFNKGYNLGKPLDERFKMICLVDNTPIVLSLANDVSYDDIFVEQLKGFLCPGDLVIGLSGSGNSENVLRAAEFAREQGNTVIGLTAYSGGKLQSLCDVNLHADIHNMQVAEDIHMILLHMIFWVLAND